MPSESGKSLSLVISAIKNMQERKGSSCQAIVNYIASVCDVPREIAQRQVMTALKRGILHGILRESDGQYSLPTAASSEYLEVASQELGLLDLGCRKRKQELRKRKAAPKKGCGTKMKRKKSRSRRRKSKSRGCGPKKRSRKRGKKRSKKARKSRSKYNCGPGKGGKRSKRRSRKGKKKAKSCECPPKSEPKPQKSDKCAMNFAEYIGKRDLFL